MRRIYLPKSPPVFRPHGRSPREQQQAYERERANTATRQLYDGAWNRAAKQHIRDNPLCRYCDLEDFVNAAVLVDHFWPHRGDRALFWDSRFWISSCAECHSGMKQSTERAGVAALLALSARLGLPPRG